MLVATTFRTPDEAVALANNTRYGLAASVWTENVNRALEVAARIKAGVVWINSTNLFDAASGFGGYRESGFGREGGREGLCEYRVADAPKGKPYPAKAAPLSALPGAAPSGEGPGLDRTAKLYVGGKQARPDSGYSYAVLDPGGREVGLAGLGNRKDIRNAVEAAAKALSWGAATAHNRAQVLYYVAENLSARADEFAQRLRAMTGVSARAAEAEVEASIRRAFFYAGFADKFDGAVHATRTRFVTLAMNEPWGVMGIVCPNEAPLLAFVSLVMPAIAMGNCVVAVPSARASAERDRLLFRARHVGRARRRRQYRDRRSERARRDARRARRRRRALVRRRRGGRGEGRGAVGRQPQGDLDGLVRRSTGRARRAANSCAARRRSRTSGRPTASERVTRPSSPYSPRAEALDEAVLAGQMQRADRDEGAALLQRRLEPLDHGRIAADEQQAGEFVLRRALALAHVADDVGDRQDLGRAALAIELQHRRIDVVVHGRVARGDGEQRGGDVRSAWRKGRRSAPRPFRAPITLTPDALAVFGQELIDLREVERLLAFVSQRHRGQDREKPQFQVMGELRPGSPAGTSCSISARSFSGAASNVS